MPTLVSRRAPHSQPVDARRVQRRAQRMLIALERSDHELSVLLTNDEFIRELNRAHRNKNRPTDVLAFPLGSTEGGPHWAGNKALGDVVISIDTACRQARKRRHSLLDEVTFLLAHGILHLVGYDHRNEREERVMNAMTKRLIASTRPRKGSRQIPA